MNILIVEDSDEKARQILDLIEEFHPDYVVHVKSLRTLYPALQTRQWDIIVLDMTLHAAEGHFSSSTKESLAGIEVLQALSVDNIKTKVIVATQHAVFKQDSIHFKSIDSLDAALKAAFPETYVGIVKVTLGQNNWKTDLSRLISSSINVNS